jgi:phosphate transport system substrate-binding protein
MMRQPPPSLTTLAVLLALTTVSESSLLSLRQAAFAQASAPLASPSEVPAGTTVRINSSNSMAAISQVQKQNFEAQFPDAKVELKQAGTDDALQALREGSIDVAAIGRPLTAAEKSEGLVEVPITRRKIAVIVGENNPFPGDLTAEQFAQIFRGEITNWSQVGGADKQIRVIDRPNSDTRQALQPYPVFQSAPFQTGATADSVDDENTNAVIRQLGDDGISYAIVDQVVNQPGVRIVSIYGTPPTDPNYAFSQPLVYVYKEANPAVQAFLGYATAPPNQQAVAALSPEAGAAAAGAVASSQGFNIFDIFKREPKPEETASPDGAASPNATASPQTAASPSPAAPADPNAQAPDGTVAQVPDADAGVERRGVPWWLWLLSLPALGILLWLLLRGSDRSNETETTAVPVSTAVLPADRDGDNSRIVLVPRNSQEAYAYWEVPEAHKQRIRQEEGGQQLALRLYDVTGQDPDRHPAHSIEQFECNESDQDLHIPIPQTQRDYLVELGYVTYQGRWCPLARSAPVYIGADGTSQTSTDSTDSPSSTDMSVLPTMPSFSDSFQSGGTSLIDPPAPSPELQSDVGPEVRIDDRRDDFGRDEFTSEFRPEAPITDMEESFGSGAALTGGLAGGAAIGAAAEATPRNRVVKRSQIVLVPRNSQEAYAYWDVLDHHKEIAKQHGGQDFILRICDVTGVDIEHQAPHSIQQFSCEETDRDRHVTVPDIGEYVAEIGYLAKNGRWLRIARSAPVHIPPVEFQ